MYVLDSITQIPRKELLREIIVREIPVTPVRGTPENMWSMGCLSAQAGEYHIENDHNVKPVQHALRLVQVQA